MTDRDSYYITTPIYYVNDVPHIGHAYTTLACDVLARFHRLDGRRVLFLTGTDEHGQKVEKSAAKAGLDPQSFCDRVAQRFRELAEVMNFSNDQFIRTTENRHKLSVQELWRRIDANGYLYEDSYAGWYSVRDEAFYAESELVEGEGGEKLAPSGAPVEWVEEPSFFFRLSAFQDRLLDFYDSNPGSVQPVARRNEVRSFVAGGLRDLSVSRTSFNWGVPVPGRSDHVMYVWIDALTNYLTAVDFPDTTSDLFTTFWPADVHMVGKDILRFHAVYWPAFLMAADIEPPRRVFAHGWWTNEGQKISKSLGNVIDPFELVDYYGLDPVRYFLMREVPFGQDGDFTREAFVHRVNADLANGIGNLAQRTLSMIAKNCAAAVPDPGDLPAADTALWDEAETVLARSRELLEAQDIHRYLEEVIRLVGKADGYISHEQPWALKKTDPDRMRQVLYVLAETVRRIAILLQPAVPDSAGAILDQLAVPGDRRSFAHLAGTDHCLVPGTPLPAPKGVFPRLTLEAE